MAVLDADAYLQDRLNQQLAWLSKASRSNKRTFLRLRILEVLLGTGITIFSPFVTRWGWGPLAIALAGGGIAVSGSLLALTAIRKTGCAIAAWPNPSSARNISSSPARCPTTTPPRPSHAW